MPTTYTAAEFQELLTNLPQGARIELEKSTRGRLIVSLEQTKDEIIKKEFPHLINESITISDAVDKYHVPRTTIEKWLYKTGDVHFADKDAYPRLINEAEVAVCAQIYRRRKQSGFTTIPYFDDDDRIITEIKHKKLAEYRRRKADYGK